jgi:hypothetical protein
MIAVAAFAVPHRLPRPVVYARTGESFIDAADRFRRATGHTGWCIIVMPRFRRKSGA